MPKIDSASLRSGIRTAVETGTRGTVAGASKGQAPTKYLYGADLYCRKESFGADLYSQNPPHGAELYCDINSKMLYR